MTKSYADNLACSNSDLSRGIAGGVVAVQMTERDFSNINCHYCNTFGHYENEFADFMAVRQQNQRRRQRQYKQRCGHQPQPRGSSSRGEEGKCGAITTRPPPTARLFAAPGQQVGLTATLTSPKSVLREFLESEAFGIFLCKTTPMRSPAPHSRREKPSLQPSPPKSK